MLGPDSRLLTALLILASVGLLAGVIRFRLLAVKIACGSLSIIVAMVGGVAAVNYYYGYYTTWGQLVADFNGGTGDLGTIPATTSSSTASAASGSIGWVTLPGKLSGYSRRGLVYLPPQYGQARYAHVRFPVVELFHGTPGTPLTWQTVLRIGQVANQLIAKHLIGPMVFVMPSINGSGHQYQDCVNGPGSNDDTYLTKDVRTDMFAHYRVSQDAYEWGLAGYSSGGFCAANLALRHRTSFGAAAVINGYFRAADGPAGTALNHSQPLEAANSPLYLAERLMPNGSPLPAFWVAAGTNDKADYQPATVFTAAVNRIEQVPFLSSTPATPPTSGRPPCPTRWPGCGSSWHHPTCGSCSPSTPGPTASPSCTSPRSRRTSAARASSSPARVPSGAAIRLPRQARQTERGLPASRGRGGPSAADSMPK